MGANAMRPMAFECHLKKERHNRTGNQDNGIE